MKKAKCPLFVVAGSYQQYVNYLRARHLSQAEARYLHDEMSLCGLRGDGVVFVLYGTYYQNPIWGSDRYKVALQEGAVERLEV